ncbi:hypothetical protein V6N13_131078 [Hibiscus sabdariffa]|uniref:Uncharacterized protein n=1 Tax=Hibiscus sabdariffa TaxID=183260 RepID=A0ABR2D6T9_9ROSI
MVAWTFCTSSPTGIVQGNRADANSFACEESTPPHGWSKLNSDGAQSGMHGSATWLVGMEWIGFTLLHFMRPAWQLVVN